MVPTDVPSVDNETLYEEDSQDEQSDDDTVKSDLTLDSEISAKSTSSNWLSDWWSSKSKVD